MKNKTKYINIFIHVPKTGGVSFVNNLSKNGIQCYPTSRFIPKIIDNPEKCVIYGHENILFFKKICKERGLKPIFYSIIRNPYRKRISKFNYGIDVFLDDDPRYKTNLKNFMISDLYKNDFFLSYINMNTFLYSDYDKKFNNENWYKNILNNSTDDYKNYFDIKSLKSNKIKDINNFSKNCFFKLSKINFIEETNQITKLLEKFKIKKNNLYNKSNFYLNLDILNDDKFHISIFDKFLEDAIIYLNFLQIKKKLSFLKFKSKKSLFSLAKKTIFKKIKIKRKKINFGNFLGFIKLSKLEVKCLINKLPIDFNPNTYLLLHEDVRLSKIDPFVHLKKYGIYENRIYKKDQNFSLKFNFINNLPIDFDPEIYLRINSDVKKIDPIEHYKKYGKYENRLIRNFEIYKINNFFYKKYFF